MCVVAETSLIPLPFSDNTPQLIAVFLLGGCKQTAKYPLESVGEKSKQKKCKTGYRMRHLIKVTMHTFKL